MYRIVDAKVIEDFAMLITFVDGKRVVFDFAKFLDEPWFERIKERFADFEIDMAGLWWGEDAISPIEIYQTGIELNKINAAA